MSTSSWLYFAAFHATPTVTNNYNFQMLMYTSGNLSFTRDCIMQLDHNNLGSILPINNLNYATILI